MPVAEGEPTPIFRLAWRLAGGPRLRLGLAGGSNQMVFNRLFLIFRRTHGVAAIWAGSLAIVQQDDSSDVRHHKCRGGAARWLRWME